MTRRPWKHLGEAGAELRALDSNSRCRRGLCLLAALSLALGSGLASALVCDGDLFTAARSHEAGGRGSLDGLGRELQLRLERQLTALAGTTP